MPEELNYEELPLYKDLLVELEVEADFWNLDIDFDKLSPETDLKDLGFDESDISGVWNSNHSNHHSRSYHWNFIWNFGIR